MSFIECFDTYCRGKGTTPFKVAQEVGVYTNFVSEWMGGKRNPRPEKAMETLKSFATSQILDIDFPTLAYWWASDYIPQESFVRAFEQLEKENPELVRQAREIKKKRKEEGKEK